MIIAVVGPTGVGKTKLSIELAKKYNGEIINADSTQVFKEMNIGTAKIDNLEGITHHLLDIKNLNEEYTVYDFQKDARHLIDDITSRNKAVIIAGGSGLYISALLFDYKFNEEQHIDINLSNEEMHESLTNLGIEIDINNNQRLQRKYIKHIINKEPINDQEATLLFDAYIIGLTTDRENLYSKINQRVEDMISNGLVEEAKDLFDKYPSSKQLASTIDYKELIPYFNNECTLEESKENMKQNSRRYAKRQYTWFNNKMNVTWFNTNYENFDETVNEVINYINH